MPLTSFYRRNLPHWQKEGAVYFVTYLIEGAIPKSLAQIYSETCEEEDAKESAAYTREENYLRRYAKSFLRLESYLEKHRGTDSYLLKSSFAQRCIIDSLIWFAKRGDLRIMAVSVMANHVHVVLDSVKLPLEELLQRHKSFTAKEVNKHLGTNGQLWHRESFDHMPRTTRAVIEKVEYTLLNPVAAGLVSQIADFTGNWWNPEVIVVDGNEVGWNPRLLERPPGMRQL